MSLGVGIGFRMKVYHSIIEHINMNIKLELFIKYWGKFYVVLECMLNIK